MPEYRAFNPQANIPVLVNGDVKVTQSLAIFAYLEALHPEPPLLPPMGAARSHVLSLAQHVACEIQPLNNLRVERYLTNTLQLGDEALRAWRRHWIRTDFDALELQLSSHPATGVFCYGDAPTVADCFLVPQVYSALRPGVAVDLADWPTMHRIYSSSLPSQRRHLPGVARGPRTPPRYHRPLWPLSSPQRHPRARLDARGARLPHAAEIILLAALAGATIR